MPADKKHNETLLRMLLSIFSVLGTSSRLCFNWSLIASWIFGH